MVATDNHRVTHITPYAKMLHINFCKTKDV
jgi:hypothetical protein